MKVYKTYTCAHCGDIFESTWTDKDAQAERDVLWPDVKDKDCVVICDECWRKYMIPTLRAELGINTAKRVSRSKYRR